MSIVKTDDLARKFLKHALSEQIAVVRRIAERGLAQAQAKSFPKIDQIDLASKVHQEYLDVFQHLLDEIRRLED